MDAPVPVVPYVASYPMVVAPRPMVVGPVIGAGWGYGPRFYGPSLCRPTLLPGRLRPALVRKP